MNREHGDLLFCDLTQSYAPHGGGGISTYLREKRRHVIERTGHRLLQIVPGIEDRIIQDGRHIWAEIAAGPVRGSPNYRFILRTGAVREVLARFRPDVIESQCPWVLPWTAINHRRSFPSTVLVAGYHTDFPNAHVGRVGAAPNLDPDYAKRFEAMYPALATRHHVAFDRFFLDPIAGQRTYFQADGLHPTFAGVKRIVMRMAAPVRAALGL